MARSLTMLVHPGGKFWATIEDGDAAVSAGTQLVFGNTSAQSQVHRRGYTTGKFPEKLAKGYVCLLNAVNIPGSLILDLKEFAHVCRDVALSRSFVIPKVKSVFDALDPFDQRSLLQVLRTQFKVPDSTLDNLTGGKQPDPARPARPIAPKSTPMQPKAEMSGPWAW